MNSISVVIVSANFSEKRKLRLAIEKQGYEVMGLSNGEDLVVPDIPSNATAILLDLDGAQQIGAATITRLKGRPQTAILAISAEAAPAAKIAMLDLGADDYITRPFVFDELFARLRAALRHVTRREDSGAVVTAGNVEIDAGRRQVRKAGELLHLTRKEYDVLATLASAPGRIVTHQQLLERAWPLNPDVRIAYLRIVVRSLRQKVEPDPVSPSLIVNQLGIGYRLNTAK